MCPRTLTTARTSVSILSRVVSWHLTISFIYADVRSALTMAHVRRPRQLLVAHGDRLAVEGKVEASEAMLARLASKMQHALTGKGATNTGQRYRAVARAAKELGMTVDKDEVRL